MQHIEMILNDIMLFLQNEQLQHTNQVLIGCDTLFRGYIVKNQIRSEQNNQYKDYNKVIAY